MLITSRVTPTKDIPVWDGLLERHAAYTPEHFTRSNFAGGRWHVG
jgi:hypothetical protein